MNSLRRSVALVVLFALAATALVRAQTPATVAGAPTTIDYQGKALDSAGALLAPTSPTNYEMQFRIYDAQEAGSIIWSEKQIVTVSKGLFSVRLGEGTANGTEGSIPQSTLSEAFNGSARFLGVTIVITGQTAAEIQPRLAFLATPFAYVANKSVTAERLILNPGASVAGSSINLAQVSYATQAVSSATSTTVTLTDQNHTAIVDAASAPTTVNLPGVTSRREYFITKRDASTNFVTVTAPVGGSINGAANGVVKLKVLGESVVIQNTGGNDWWVISDTRDSTPVGTIIVSAQNSGTPPRGYVACDGTTYSRTAAQFADLSSAIGTAWGNNNTATDFKVPDLRGVFLRGVDGGRNFDPDRNSRTASNTGGNAGDAVGSSQDHAFHQHNHTFSASGNTGNAGTHNHQGGVSPGTDVPYLSFGLIRRSDGRGNYTASNKDDTVGEPELNSTSIKGIPMEPDHAHAFSISGTSGFTGAGETRPKNVAVYYFIKY